MDISHNIKKTERKASLLVRRIYNRKYGQIRNPRSRYGYLLYNKKNEDLIGIDYYEYAIYLEKNNKDNLKFAKYEFDLDHILPLARSLTPQEYLSRWNYQNTCMEDVDINRKKANRYDHEYAIRKIILRDKYPKHIRKEKQIKVFDEFYSYEQLKYILMYSDCSRFEYFIKDIYSMEHIGDIKNNCINFSFNNETFIDKPSNYLVFSSDIVFNLRKFLFIINPIEYFNHRQALIDLVDEPKKIFQKLAAEYELVKSEKIDNEVAKIIEKFSNKIDNKKNDFIECQKIIKAYYKDPIKEKKFLKFIKKLQSKNTYKVGELKAFNELTSDTKSKIVLTEISDGINCKKILIEELKNGFKNGLITQKKYAQTLIDVLEIYNLFTVKRDLVMTLYGIWEEGLITEKQFIKPVRKLASQKSNNEKGGERVKQIRGLINDLRKDGLITKKFFQKEVDFLKKKILDETKRTISHNSLAFCLRMLREDYQNGVFDKKEFKKEFLTLIEKLT